MGLLQPINQFLAVFSKIGCVLLSGFSFPTVLPFPKKALGRGIFWELGPEDLFLARSLRSFGFKAKWAQKPLLKGPGKIFPIFQGEFY